MPATLQIPEERLTQLKQISHAFGGLSLPATFGQMIRELVHAGIIDCPSILNIDIKAAPDGLAIRFDDGEYVAFKSAAAKALIASLRQYADVPDPQNPLPIVINKDSNFTIARKVRAVKITIPALSTDAITKTLSPDLASDFADLIEAALKNVTIEV
jgi:hypothetical protein